MKLSELEKIIKLFTLLGFDIKKIKITDVAKILKWEGKTWKR